MNITKNLVPCAVFFILLFQLVGCGGGGGSASSVSPDPLDNWHSLINLRYTPDGDLKVNFHNGVFLAVGLNGTILTSSDGTHWARQKTDTFSHLHQSSYGNGTYVVIAMNGTVLTSHDSIQWTERNSGVSYFLNGISFANGTFVIVGNSGTILSSSDSLNWTIRTSGVYPDLLGVTYGNGIFVAVGRQGTILSSTDGIAWTVRSSGVEVKLNGVAYGNGTFVAVGEGGLVLTSLDGVTWIAGKVTDEVFFELLSVNFVKDTFYVDCGYGRHAVDYNVLSSTDGKIWTSRDTPVRIGLAYGNGTFVGASYTTLFTSDDLNTWRIVSLNNSLEGNIRIYDIAYGKGRFVVLSQLGTIVSDDGIKWLTRFEPLDHPQSIDFLNGSFVGVGNDWFSGDTLFYSSLDGITWTKTVIGQLSLSGNYKIAYGNSTYAIVSGNTVLSSKDGIAWSQRTVTFPQLKDVAFGNGLFVAVGDTGTIITSPDGIQWTLRPTGTSARLERIVYGNSTFVVLGDSFTPKLFTLTSSDGLTWTSKAHDLPNILGPIAFGSGIFITPSINDKMFISADGHVWSEKNSGFFDPLSKIIHVNGTFVAIGFNKIIQSSPLN